MIISIVVVMACIVFFDGIVVGVLCCIIEALEVVLADTSQGSKYSCSE